MFVITILIFIIATMLLLMLLTTKQEDFLAAKRQNDFLVTEEEKKQQLIDEFSDKITNEAPWLIRVVGKKNIASLIVWIPILMIVSNVLATNLTQAFHAVMLTGIIFLAYFLRVFFHMARGFRSKSLKELERLLITIRNNLSSGLSLDKAIFMAAEIKQEGQIITEFKRFIKINETNLIETFPSWLINIKNNFNLKDLAESAQVLTLDLKYSNNQEEAFVNAVNKISERIKTNFKQKNTLLMSFITMDFLVIFFLGMLFWLIPTLNSDNDWWFSDRRSVVVFSSAAFTWSAYALTVGIAMWRQN